MALEFVEGEDSKAGGADMSSLDAEIYGMTLSQMNQLTTFGTQFATVGKNYITVQAGDAGGQLSTVFVGTSPLSSPLTV